MAERRFARRHGAKIKIATALLGKVWLRLTLTFLGVAFLVGGATVLWWSKDLPNPQNISTRQVQESTKIYDRTGQHVLFEIGDVHRTVVPLDKISSYVRQATIAAEDANFYEHHGLAIKGIIRGVILKPLSGQRAQGGSTITQQLIKNALLTPERTLQRKVKEAVLALELEQRFSKDQILEMYLNAIPYGSQAYGVEAAAKTFFDKSASDLTLAQATALAALPQAPSYYSPYGSHFEDLKRRQEYVLQRMVDLKMISQDQADQAKREELAFTPRQEAITAPHFVFYVKEQLDNEYGERVVEQGGLNIATTLDVELQKIAEETLKEQQKSLNSLGASNAALVAIDPKTGDILAMAGSVDYFNQEIDGNVNVAVRTRSPGSSIKPFVYAAAFRKGFTPDTILVDAETDFGQGYKPKNYNLQEYGPVSMRQALANSLNIPAVKTLYLVGIKEATTLAQKMGMTTLTDPDRYGLSLVLGGGDVRLVDETSAYGVFANDGVRLPHRAILKVNDSNKTLFDASTTELQGEQVVDPQIARQVTDVLSDNGSRSMIFGAQSPLQLGTRPVAAKTGTSQEFHDGWTMGYTPSLVVGVWTGNNNYTPMKDSSDGVRTAGPIWNKFMRRALTGKPIEQFVKPESPQNITNQILQGKLSELKARWEPETNQVYSLECPVAIGEPKTFKELHSILFYVNRNNPQGPPPTTAEDDPQFENWEAGVAAWRDKHNEKTKNDPTTPHYVDSLPEAMCGIESTEDLPQVHIIEPDTTILRESPVTIRTEIESQQDIKEVRFLLDGKEIARRGPNDPYTASFSFPNDFSGRMTIEIRATTTDNLVGRAHRTFIINPDADAPLAEMHTPKDGETLTPNNFPYTVKISASDSNKIDMVDVLYQKDGQSGTRRIDRTSTTSPIAANRYEVQWLDSPGPGTYRVYAIVYDKTGNFTQTREHIVTIE